MARRFDDGAREIRVPPHEFWLELPVQPHHVVEHEHLAVAGRASADTDRGNGDRLSDLGGESLRHAFEHYGKATGSRKRDCVLEDLPGGARLPALNLEAAELVKRLRSEADVTHDRYVRGEDRLDLRE